MKIRFTFAVVAALLFAVPAYAQTGSSTPTGSPPVPEHGEEIDLPIGSPFVGLAEAEPEPTEDDPPTLYDEELPTKTDSIIYVLDISGSMDWDNQSYTGMDGQTRTGTRLDRAKAELMKSINALSEDFEFNVYAYDCDIRRWSAGKQKADPGPKSSAISWVGGLRALGATGTGPAVVAALGDKANFTVVLLTDGAPNCGANSTRGHLTMIQAANSQRAAIHVFGIAAYGEYERFCRDVAGTSGGRYIPVP
jgi:hypothetical protein